MAGGVLVVLIAALCAVASPAVAQTTVRVASSGIASDIGFFLALKKSYFRDEGLTVELTQMANAPQIGAALLTSVQSGKSHDYIPFTGQSAGLIKQVTPAAEILRNTISEAEQILRAISSP